MSRCSEQGQPLPNPGISKLSNRLAAVIALAQAGTPAALGALQEIVQQSNDRKIVAATFDANPAVTFASADVRRIQSFPGWHRYTGGKMHGPAGQLLLRVANDWHCLANIKQLMCP